MHWLALKGSFAVQQVAFLARMIGLGSRLRQCVSAGQKSEDVYSFTFSLIKSIRPSFAILSEACDPLIRVHISRHPHQTKKILRSFLMHSYADVARPKIDLKEH